MTRKIGPDITAHLPRANGDPVKVGSVEQLFANMKASESDEMTFALTREPEPGKTFSAEGIDHIARNIKTFLVARTAAHWEKIGEGLTDEGFDATPGPFKMEVEVKVTIGDERWTVAESLYPWYTIADGEHRGGEVH